MKVQTAVLLLCFLSGVFLSVVQAKPSPALMRELVALEKYLEKKEGSEGTDGQNEKPNEEEAQNNPIDFLNQKPTENDKPHNIGQEEGPIDNGPDKTKNENNNNGETVEGSGPEDTEQVVPPTKPEETPGPSENGEEALNQEGASSASGGKMKGNPSEELGNERGEIYKILDELTRNIGDAFDKLRRLGENIRAQFENDDLKITKLEDNFKKADENRKEKISQVKTILEEIKKSTNGQDETPSVGKKSVRENVPARRSHMSDTEFLNMLHSLLA